MTIDLIELVKQQVSAIALDGDTTHLFEKNSAINQFIPILLSIFRSKPQLVESLQKQLNPRITDIFTANPNLKDQFLNHLSGGAPASEIEHSLNKSIAPTLGVLENEAGSSDPSAITHLLDTHADRILSAVPQWALPILAGLGINTAAGRTLHQAPVLEPTSVVAEEKKSNWLIPLIALLIILGLLTFLFKACSKKEEPATSATTVTQTAATQPARLQLTTGTDGMLTNCQIQTGDATYLDILQQQVKQIFTFATGCGATSDASYHNEFIDQDTIPTVLQKLKGVPNTTLTWTEKQISILSTNPADAKNLAEQIKPLAKNMTVMVQEGVNEQTTVDNSISDAQKALASINPDQIRALDVATALNLQIINFATGSSDIPQVNKSILDQAAALMQRAPQVHLTVQGHTDAVGDASANKKLSQERAQSVVDYLVSKGVDPAQLQAVGYGQEKPVADNSTKEGQFKNRRIEFEVLNTDNGKVREVNEEGVTETRN
ncbi:hypothetical protein B9T33_05020 [Acinetobacter sp. ANC 5054]|uniref:OmpA family protein n=1 Tax=Acinetobacter sp. ANC 5054 TaxID=1977877 RepID=UPI000A34134B|nr:OmpA family protein [Acinetobacter sp. ANC 5054]OTG82811.1 hypothetical protein B9T33_05020 [Acinetobacter sp. ANC 5054]